MANRATVASPSHRAAEAFALLASLALHDKTSLDARFLKTLPLI